MTRPCGQEHRIILTVSGFTASLILRGQSALLNNQTARRVGELLQIILTVDVNDLTASIELDFDLKVSRNLAAVLIENYDLPCPAAMPAPTNPDSHAQ